MFLGFWFGYSSFNHILTTFCYFLPILTKDLSIFLGIARLREDGRDGSQKKGDSCTAKQKLTPGRVPKIVIFSYNLFPNVS